MDICPIKDEKYHVSITVGGNKLDFCGDSSSVAASLDTVKFLLNGVVSTKDAVFTTADIKDVFYASFLSYPEYKKMKLKMIPQEIIDQYHLQDLQENC